MENKFRLTNVVLYAKGWYLITDNIWDDLKKILELDGYTPYTNSDVYSILLSAVQESKIYRWAELKEVMIGIHPNECWKVGYYIKGNNWIKNSDNLPEYDMPTAFIKYVLSNLRFMSNENWNPQMPKVTKYPKGTDITIRKLFDVFNKN